VKETASIADYIYLISEGKVVGQGTPEEIERSESPWVRQFMHGLADGPVPFHYPARNYAGDLMGFGKSRRRSAV
jgi:phospholipid/cholesterol/gamma-HCH transport system ATP-binding protein